MAEGPRAQAPAWATPQHCGVPCPRSTPHYRRLLRSRPLCHARTAVRSCARRPKRRLQQPPRAVISSNPPAAARCDTPTSFFHWLLLHFGFWSFGVTGRSHYHTQPGPRLYAFRAIVVVVVCHMWPCTGPSSMLPSPLRSPPPVHIHTPKTLTHTSHLAHSLQVLVYAPNPPPPPPFPARARPPHLSPISVSRNPPPPQGLSKQDIFSLVYISSSSETYV
ncbi:hypothetical protein BKA62DRAFT_716183, partial [Auriculariales sp. MPI-PUGE-AT-0066]